MAKLCAKNHIRWGEAREVIGNNQDRSIVSELGGDPDDISNFDLPNLISLTQWTEDQVQSGFSDFYLPYWMKGASPVKPDMSRQVRVCKSCAELGIHLTIHQFLDWTHCPLHRQRLLPQCIKCDSELGTYSLTDDFPDRACCPECQWTLWSNAGSANATEPIGKSEFVESYTQWQTQIKEYFCRDDNLKKWYGEPSGYDHLAHANIVVPGPKWVARCIVRARKIAVRDRLENYVSYDEAGRAQRESERADYKPPMPDEVDKFHYVYSDAIRRKIIEKRDTLLRRHPPRGERSGVSEFSSDHCIIQHGPGITCWATAHWLWRRAFDAAWPDEEQWSRSRQPILFNEITMIREWSAAFHGKASLYDYDRDPVEHYIRILQMSEIWIDEWLESAYYGFLALSCHATELRALNTNDLTSELLELGFTPRFAVKMEEFTNLFFALSPMPRPEFFIELQESGFTGNDENLTKSFNKLLPLFEAVGLHPKLKRRWRAESKRIRAAQCRKSRR